MTDNEKLIEKAERARARCNDAVIALRIANRPVPIDLMTGAPSTDPLWPGYRQSCDSVQAAGALGTAYAG